MTEQELILETLKDRARKLDLEDLINQKKNDFYSWLIPFYTQDQIDLNTQQYDIEHVTLWSEPTWPPGRVKQHRRQWEKYHQKIRDLENLKQTLRDLAYPDNQDDFKNDYQIRPIWVIQTPNQDQ